MTAKKSQSWRQALPRRVEELQRTVEKEVRKGLERATELLPPAPRKAVKRLTANVDQVRHDLRKRGDKMVADVRKRAERLTEDVQKRIDGVVAPVTRRFDLASRAEVNRLHQRLHDLERRVATQTHPASPTV
jgi:polyhydroxyalkanoate synthesis regulator phasin